MGDLRKFFGSVLVWLIWRRLGWSLGPPIWRIIGESKCLTTGVSADSVRNAAAIVLAPKELKR